jgi:hypothetical protein
LAVWLLLITTGGEIVRALSFYAALALLAQAPSGVCEIELWPGEGRPQFQVMANELAIHDTPSSSARIVRRLSVARGQDIAFDETRYRTTESGHLQVLAPTRISGRVLGAIPSLSRDAYYMGQFPRQEIACKQGDVIEYLQYRTEGTCFVRVADQVVDADPCPAQDDRAFRLATEPKTEWWIRVVVDRVPVGWVMVDAKAVKQSGRTF